MRTKQSRPVASRKTPAKAPRKSAKNAKVPTSADGAQPRKHRARSGMAALRKIKYYQSHEAGKTQLRLAPFARLVRGMTVQIAESLFPQGHPLHNGDLRFQAKALASLQIRTEAYMVEILEKANLLSTHRERKTVVRKDVTLAGFLQDKQIESVKYQARVADASHQVKRSKISIEQHFWGQLRRLLKVKTTAQLHLLDPNTTFAAVAAKINANTNAGRIANQAWRRLSINNLMLMSQLLNGPRISDIPAGTGRGDLIARIDALLSGLDASHQVIAPPPVVIASNSSSASSASSRSSLSSVSSRRSSASSSQSSQSAQSARSSQSSQSSRSSVAGDLLAQIAPNGASPLAFLPSNSQRTESRSISRPASSRRSNTVGLSVAPSAIPNAPRAEDQLLAQVAPNNGARPSAFLPSVSSVAPSVIPNAASAPRPPRPGFIALPPTASLPDAAELSANIAGNNAAGSIASVDASVANSNQSGRQGIVGNLIGAIAGLFVNSSATTVSASNLSQSAQSDSALSASVLSSAVPSIAENADDEEIAGLALEAEEEKYPSPAAVQPLQSVAPANQLALDILDQFTSVVNAENNAGRTISPWIFRDSNVQGRAEPVRTFTLPLKPTGAGGNEFALYRYAHQLIFPAINAPNTRICGSADQIANTLIHRHTVEDDERFGPILELIAGNQIAPLSANTYPELNEEQRRNLHRDFLYALYFADSVSVMTDLNDQSKVHGFALGRLTNLEGTSRIDANGNIRSNADLPAEDRPEQALWHTVGRNARPLDGAHTLYIAQMCGMGDLKNVAQRLILGLIDFHNDQISTAFVETVRPEEINNANIQRYTNFVRNTYGKIGFQFIDYKQARIGNNNQKRQRKRDTEAIDRFLSESGVNAMTKNTDIYAYENLHETNNSNLAVDRFVLIPANVELHSAVAISIRSGIDRS